LFIMYFQYLETNESLKYKQFKILNKKFPMLKDIYDSINLNGYYETKIDNLMQVDWE